MSEVLNLDKVLSKFKNIENIDLTPVLERACLMVENDAKQNCPTDTGQLKGSITHEVQGNTGVVGTNVEYAPYVEYGTGLFARDGNGRQTPWVYRTADGEFYWTRGQHPQPYLEPALDSNRASIEQWQLNM